MPVETEASLRATLPGSYYHSEAVWALEKARIFSRSWMCVARADEVASPGRVVTVQVADENVLVLTDRSGTLHAFLNVCRHRGSRLCTTESAQLGSTIRCPYHGWTYGLDGHLLAAPNMVEMPDLQKELHGLVEVRAESWGGYVWCCTDPGAGTLSEQLEPQIRERLGSTEVLDAYRLDELAVGHTVVYDVAANWKALVENFTECYHCPNIHPELTAAVPEFASGYGSISGGLWHGAKLAEGVDAFSSSGRSARRRLPGLSSGAERLFYGVVFPPNVFLILVPDHVVVFRIEPLAPDRTLVTCDWLFEAGVVAAEGFDPADSVEILDVTNRQDFAACERCQLNMGSKAFTDGGVLVPSEHLILDFYRYLATRLGLDGAGWPAIS